MTGSRQTILTIDHDEHASDFICTALCEKGFTVHTSSDIGEGFRKFTELKPDLVILNIETFSDNGFKPLRELTQTDPHALVICMGTSHDDALAMECIRHGAKDYLKKPLGLKDLLGSIERITTHQHLLKTSTEPDVTCVQLETKRLVFGNDTKKLPYIINQAVYNAGAVCPDIVMLKIALSEIVLNAIEHGNLGITMKEKSAATERGDYKDILSQRRNDPRYKDRVVTLDVSMDREKLVYTVTDQGEGFDYENVLDSDPSSHIGSGLGLFIVRSFFSEVVYEGCGNRVRLVYLKSLRKKQMIPPSVDYQEFLHKLTNTLPSGFLVLTENGSVTFWNDAAEQITSISRSDMIGTRREDLADEIAQLLNPEIDEVMLINSDGEPRVIDKSIHEIELDGGIRNTAVIFSDITDMLNRKREMEILLMETAESKDLMEEQAAKLAMALAEVDEKNDIIEGQNIKMVDELKMAGRLQKSLLPNIYENLNGVSVSSKYIPSIHIGGDLYDVVDIGHGMTGFIIADVSGHGVAAALVSSMFKMSFHALAANVASPKILFHMLNQEFNPILTEDYITAFYLLADCTTNTITYANAAHPTPLLFKKRTSEIIELDTDGLFLGMFDEGMYEEKTITNIENGDALLLYTDCILETENTRREPFGKNRLKDVFARSLKESHGQDVIDRIEAEVRNYNACENFDDDFTMLLLEFWEQATRVQGISSGDNTLETGGFIEF